MHKDRLIRLTARHTGVSREAVELVINTFIDLVKKQVEKGERVTLSGFVSLYLRNKADFMANDIPRRKRMKVRGGWVPWAHVSEKWKEEVKLKHRDHESECKKTD